MTATFVKKCYNLHVSAYSGILFCQMIYFSLLILFTDIWFSPNADVMLTCWHHPYILYYNVMQWMSCQHYCLPVLPRLLGFLQIGATCPSQLLLSWMRRASYLMVGPQNKPTQSMCLFCACLIQIKNEYRPGLSMHIECIVVRGG